MVNKEFFGETRNIEFKRELPSKHEKFLKDIIAFSNSTGGQVILGIEDETCIVYGIGEQSPFKMSDSISNMISDACTPQIEPDISIQTIEDKTVLVINVAPGKFRPYYLANKDKKTTAYIRINGTSRPADARKLQELELEGQNISYDSLQDIGREYDENKALELCKTMKKIAVDACETEEDKLAIKDMTLAKLHDFGILCMVGRNPYPTHAFDLLTDNTNKAAKIQCALFKGKTRDIFIDRKEFDGPIYEQIDNAYHFVLRHIDMGANIDAEYRKDIYELPISAVRETIANAVLHRSYLDRSCVQVCIYDDRMEVSSPGMLYGGLDIETAKTGKSTCRNEAIAEAFHYMHIVEAWGTGIPRIINRCNEYGLPAPVFEEFGDGFKVTLFRKVSNASEKVSNASEKVSNTSEKASNASEKVSNASEKVSNASEKVSNASEKVSNASEKISNASEKASNAFDEFIPLLKAVDATDIFIKNIRIVYEHYNASMPFGQSNVMEWLKCSKSKATNIMKTLKKANIIEKVKGFGAGKYRFMDLHD